MRRKPDGEQRRRDLCDAAIALLAQDGARGLTHLRVDRRAGFADGTTSFYFQTRSALLRAVTDRVVQLDVEDFTTAMTALDADGDPAVDSLLSRLAEQAMRTAVEPERSRARARFELFMIGAREPELGAVLSKPMDQFVAISEQAVAQVQPDADGELIKEQAFAVVTFLGGFLFRLANGMARLESATQLEGYLHAVIAGVAVQHSRIRGD